MARCDFNRRVALLPSPPERPCGNCARTPGAQLRAIKGRALFLCLGKITQNGASMNHPEWGDFANETAGLSVCLFLRFA
jgi:hypothetical protein